MNCSFCACAVVAAMTPAATTAAPISTALRSPIVSSLSAACLAVSCRNPSDSASVREGPQPQLFLGDRPQSREAMRFNHEEKHDQGAENHRLEVRHRGRADLPAEGGTERRQ